MGARLASSFAVLFAQARLLGVVDFGHFAFGLSCAAILALFFDLGTILHALRTIAAAPDTASRQIRADLRTRLLVAGPLAVAAGLAVFLTAPAAHTLAFAVIYASLAVQIMGDYNAAILRALGRYATEAIIAAAGNGLYALLAVSVLLLAPTIEAAAFSLLAGRLIALTLTTGALVRALPGVLVSSEAGPIAIGANFRSTLPYAKDIILANSMSQIDMAMAGWLFSPVDLGLYAVASRVFQVINQVLGALANVFIPSLAAHGGDTSHRARILRSLNAVTLLLASGALAGAAFAGPTLGTVLGQSYGHLGTLWPVVGAAAAARVLASGSALALTGSGLQAFRVRALMWGFGALVIGGGAGGYWYGLAGYVWAGAASFGAMTVLQLVFLRREAGIVPFAAPRVGQPRHRDALSTAPAEPAPLDNG